MLLTYKMGFPMNLPSLQGWAHGQLWQLRLIFGAYPNRCKTCYQGKILMKS